MIVCLVFEFLKLFEDGEIFIVFVFIICERDVNSFWYILMMLFMFNIFCFIIVLLKKFIFMFVYLIFFKIFLRIFFLFFVEGFMDCKIYWYFDYWMIVVYIFFWDRLIFLVIISFKIYFFGSLMNFFINFCVWGRRWEWVWKKFKVFCFVLLLLLLYVYFKVLYIFWMVNCFFWLL